MTTIKRYPHITGLIGDEGENAATLAVAAVLDPSPNYPDCARITVGHARSSECSDKGACLAGDPDTIDRLADTLRQAAADVRAALATGRGESKPPAPIPALWFTADGGGPDSLALQLHPFPAEMDGAIPAWLGIRVRAGDLPTAFNAAPLIDGGFNLDRASAAELHAQLGAWLEAHRE
jgi:hypothetical protein